GRCAYATGYQREVFQSAPSVAEGVQHQLVPYLAGAYAQPYMLVVFGDDIASFQFVFYEQSVHGLGEQDVAAAAEDGFLEGQGFVVRKLFYLRRLIEYGKIFGGYIHTEGVIGL